MERGGSLSGAARLLGVDATTVSRRLKDFESRLGTRLFERTGRGGIHLTPAGEIALKHGETVEREFITLHARISGADTALSGNVVLTIVPFLANRLIIPHLNTILQRHPDLEIELKSDNRNLNLVKRETDLAVRLARPKLGGTSVKARRIGTLKYGVYVSAGGDMGGATDLPWLTYRDELSELPQVVWLDRQIRLKGGETAMLKLSDTDSVIEAVASGRYRAIIPTLIGDAEPRLQRLDGAAYISMLEREVWLLVHTDLANLARIKAVGGWLEGLFKPGAQ